MNYLAVFSPTGGVKSVADCLTGDGWETLDLTRREVDFSERVFTNEDVLLAAVPSYGGRVPDPAARRLTWLRGNGARAVLLCVYGNRAYEDTLVELEDLLQAAGFRCVAAVAAVAEHSIMRSVAAGRPDEADRAELAGFAARVREHLASGAEGPVQVPGSHPYREYCVVPMTPRATAGCTGCGACAAGCPMGAIAPSRPQETDKEACISCMRCVSVCPRNAREVDGQKLAAITEKLRKVCEGRKPNELFL